MNARIDFMVDGKAVSADADPGMTLLSSSFSAPNL